MIALGFSHGPFSFDPAARGALINGRASRRWTMRYGEQEIASRYVDDAATKSAVIESFGDDRADFIRRAAGSACVKSEAPEQIEFARIVRSSETTGAEAEDLGQFIIRAPIPGLTAGLIDDRFETWLVTDAHPRRALPMSIDEFERLRSAHTAIRHERAQRAICPPRAWIAKLLPLEVLAVAPENWRAPSSWEIRHVVGEGSFTGISGSAAASLIGVAPNNFRKYTAHDGAKNRQHISYAAWHLLLQRLGVLRP